MDPVSGAILGAAVAGLSAIIASWIGRPSRQKINETHHQTTQNGGRNNPPTIPDQLHKIDTKVDALIDRLDRHIEWHMEQK